VKVFRGYGWSLTRRDAAKIPDNFRIGTYSGGLNANMCRALSKISLNGNREIEYRVVWSPTVKADEELDVNRGIIFTERNNSYVKDAEGELSVLEPEKVRISGHVVGTLSKDAPLTPSTPRYVRNC
jgi:hypothetical protein